MTVRRERTAAGSDAKRLRIEPGGFLCGDGLSTGSEAAVGETQGSCQVGGYAAVAGHGALRMRQEGGEGA